MYNMGAKILWKEIPADLKATNSKCSPRLPKVIREEIKTANGSAKGTKLKEDQKSNLRITKVSNPLPTRSSTYLKRNCINNTKMEMQKVTMKGPIKDLKISKLRRFKRA